MWTRLKGKKDLSHTFGLVSVKDRTLMKGVAQAGKRDSGLCQVVRKAQCQSTVAMRLDEHL